jgi:hypothetical protein
MKNIASSVRQFLYDWWVLARAIWATLSQLLLLLGEAMHAEWKLALAQDKFATIKFVATVIVCGAIFALLVIAAVGVCGSVYRYIVS